MTDNTRRDGESSQKIVGAVPVPGDPEWLRRFEEKRAEIDKVAQPWGYRDPLIVAALAWGEAQNDMRLDRRAAHGDLMRAVSTYRQEHGL